MLRREKKDVLDDLPQKTRAKLYLKPNDLKEYERVRRDTKLMPAAKLQKLLMALAEAKVKPVLDWLEMHPDPIVIWIYHRDIGNLLSSALSCPLIIGGTPQNIRQEAIDAFQDGHVKRIVCSSLAAGTGITLTAASQCLFTEEPFTPAQVQQAEDRVHRIGQRYPVTAWHVIVPNTIDEYVWKLLTRKQKIFDETISILPDLLKVI